MWDRFFEMLLQKGARLLYNRNRFQMARIVWATKGWFKWLK